KNDGQCTLREALENAAQAGSPDCAYGGSSTDTILLPAGDIQLQDTLIIEGGGIELLGKGALDKDPGDDEETLSRILGDGTFRLFEVQPPNSSSGHPSVRFQFLTLESGYAPGAGETGSGAVIVTGGSVIFDRVRILNNEAEASGGVAFIRSNAGNEKILTFNNSFVSGNTAGVSGGVMSSNAQNGETFKLVLVGSTFEGNSAVNEGGVLDANIAAGEVQIANSTFVNNSAGQKGSALDLSGITVRANIMNSSFMNNTGSSGIDLGDAPSEIRLSNSAYFNSGSSCSSGTTVLHHSQYNAFSGTACAATTESNNQTSTGAGSLSATLSDPEGEGANDDYLPPYLPIVDAATDSVLVDMGNDQDALASGTGSPMSCRAEDLRGIARTSGGRCDIGAFEYQQITAEDDEGSNQNIPARKVPVDILDNDLPSDGAEFGLLTNSPTFDFTFEHAELVTLDPEEFTG
ncbi:MAG: choice-of-anchor Q domain-containing protein, partial [Oceanospirillum sp.]|nr:choice-of-anchor Q domain-containing protein [Oceanospirillum sp.]